MGPFRKFVYKYLLPREVGEQMLEQSKPRCDECYCVIEDDADHAMTCSHNPHNIFNRANQLAAALMPQAVPIPESMMTASYDTEFLLQAVSSTSSSDVLKTLNAALPDVVRLKPGSFYIKQEEDGSQSTEMVGIDPDGEGFERQYLIETEGSTLWFEYTGIRYGVNVTDIDMTPRDQPPAQNRWLHINTQFVGNTVVVHNNSGNLSGNGGAGGSGIHSVSIGGNAGGTGGLQYDPQTGTTTS